MESEKKRKSDYVIKNTWKLIMTKQKHKYAKYRMPH